MQMLGEWLFCGASSEVSVLTSWMDRQAMNGVATYETIALVGGTALDVSVLHKNRDEVGNGSAAGSTWYTSGLFSYANLTNLKEMVRFKIRLIPDFTEGAACFRFLPLTWYDNAAT